MTVVLLNSDQYDLRSKITKMRELGWTELADAISRQVMPFPEPQWLGAVVRVRAQPKNLRYVRLHNENATESKRWANGTHGRAAWEDLDVIEIISHGEPRSPEKEQ